MGLLLAHAPFCGVQETKVRTDAPVPICVEGAAELTRAPTRLIILYIELEQRYSVYEADASVYAVIFQQSLILARLISNFKHIAQLI